MGDKKSIGSGTVIKSISASLYYHTGTAAIGSLIIAVIRIIRALIAKLQKKAQEMDNKVGQCILCCCQCCLWCFEKFMRFLNKNAYVQTAIFGTSFCTSAKNAFFLILRNAKRVAGISYVLSVLIWISRLFIAFLTAGLSYIVMERKIEEQLHSLFGPTVLVFLFPIILRICSWICLRCHQIPFFNALLPMKRCLMAKVTMQMEIYVIGLMTLNKGRNSW